MKRVQLVLTWLLAICVLLCACSQKKPDDAVYTDDTGEVTMDIPENTTVPETTGAAQTERREKERVDFPAGDQQIYENLQQLIEHSDWIVRGTVIAQRCEWRPIAPAELDSSEDFYTVTTLQIEEIYKGELTCETIDVLEKGGETDTTIYSYGYYADFEMNKSYVVFLSMSISGENIGVLIGHNQGRYLVENSEIKADSDRSFHGLDFTFTELNELKAKLSAEKEIVTMDIDRQIYTSQEELTDSAEWIVRGTVIGREYSTRVDPFNEESGERKLFTVTYLQVEEAYKGELPYKIIAILEEGGKTDTEFYTYAGYTTLETGAEYVVYLDVAPYNPFYAALKGRNQGCYLVEDGKLIADVDAEGVSGFDITLTELNELKAELMVESEKME